MGRSSVEIKDQEGNGSLFLATTGEEGRDESSFDDFDVRVVTPTLTAETKCSEFPHSTLASFFEDLASHWRGWEGSKEWKGQEGRLGVMATHDGYGHVQLVWDLSPPDWRWEWRVSITTKIAAGDSLSLIAKGLADLHSR